ncbi:unnamed protein product, partial [Choristocarpus tenellus]
STLEIVALPSRGSTNHLVQALEEAQKAALGGLEYKTDSRSVGRVWEGCSAVQNTGSLWSSDMALSTYSDLMLAVPEEINSVALSLHCMVEAVIAKYTGKEACQINLNPPKCLAPAWELPSSIYDNDYEKRECQKVSSTPLLHYPPPISALMPRNVVLDYGDRVGEHLVRGAVNQAAAGEGRIDPRALVAVERASLARLQCPRVIGHGGLPLESQQHDEDRGAKRCELLYFTDLGPKDVDRVRQIWALERLVNTNYPPSKGRQWSFSDRRCWDILPPHVVTQIFQAENATNPVYLKSYYQFKHRPAFKDWADIAPPKDLSYTPRTLYALGAIMDISKKEIGRAHCTSVHIYPSDKALIVLSGFKENKARWLSVFKDRHVMGLRLCEFDDCT